jgi:hypothetical protein
MFHIIFLSLIHLTKLQSLSSTTDYFATSDATLDYTTNSLKNCSVEICDPESNGTETRDLLDPDLSSFINQSSLLSLDDFEETTGFFYSKDPFFSTTMASVANTKLRLNDTLELVGSEEWPIKKAAVVEGNVILGGLMMVHEREDNMTCGPIFEQGGIQALEAMLYTLDRINEGNLLPNITIGAHILDDCDKDTYGLEIAVDFIKGESHLY